MVQIFKVSFFILLVGVAILLSGCTREVDVESRLKYLPAYEQSRILIECNHIEDDNEWISCVDIALKGVESRRKNNTQTGIRG